MTWYMFIPWSSQYVYLESKSWLPLFLINTFPIPILLASFLPIYKIVLLLSQHAKRRQHLVQPALQIGQVRLERTGRLFAPIFCCHANRQRTRSVWEHSKGAGPGSVLVSLVSPPGASGSAISASHSRRSGTERGDSRSDSCSRNFSGHPPAHSVAWQELKADASAAAQCSPGRGADNASCHAMRSKKKKAKQTPPEISLVPRQRVPFAILRVL